MSCPCDACRESPSAPCPCDACRRSRATSGVDLLRIRDDVEAASWERIVSAGPHAIRIGIRLTPPFAGTDPAMDLHVAGCSCGWSPEGPEDEDDQIARHVALARFGAQHVRGIAERRRA